MVTRTIQLDDDVGQLLDSVIEAYDGDANSAISDFLRIREIDESYLEKVEAKYAVELAAQKERSEREFREGHFVSWEEVKRRNGL